jgi:hypothetical protein
MIERIEADGLSKMLLVSALGNRSWSNALNLR